MVLPSKKFSEVSFFWLVFLIFMFFFIYFRALPIINQTVPYTFDQGRDFLKAHEIIHDRNLTLLGPTTGIGGLFHGVWWYYFLSIPYIISNGNPSGFLIFIVIISFIQNILFTLFLKNKFGTLPSLLFWVIVSASPYFIQMSSFAISSILVLPFLLLFFYALYQYLENKTLPYLFLVFLSLGFVFEAELPSGIFLIPSFFLTVFLLRKFKLFLGSLKKLGVMIFGFLIPLIPRILFEFTHNFLQTKALFGFLIKPKFNNPSSFFDIVSARFNLFQGYYYSLFPESSVVLSFIFFLAGLSGIYFLIKRDDRAHIVKTYLYFILTTFILLFFLSLFYKDSFWANYYEGLSYFYGLFLMLGIYGLVKEKRNVIAYVLIALLLGFSSKSVITSFNTKPKIEGMKEQISVVDRIYKLSRKENVCVRIYTPPVIPHTYNYLFTYYSQAKGYTYPSHDFVNDQCYYVFERDQYSFRIDDWRKLHIPKDAKLLQKESISSNTYIELWQQRAQ